MFKTLYGLRRLYDKAFSLDGIIVKNYGVTERVICIEYE